MLLLDAHADTPQRFADEHWHFSDPLRGGHLNLAAARAAGLSGQFFAIWPEPVQWRGRYAHRTLALIDSVLEQVRRAPDDLTLCCTADEVLLAQSSGRFAVLMGIEGGHAIESSLGLLRQYFRLGVRYLTLTWSNTNEWADSSGDLEDLTTHHHGGLTPFGCEVVLEMNRLGMMVDVSHVSDATFDHVLATSKVPLLASHSSARSLTDSPRNLTDDMIRAIATNDGAIMVNFYSAFIDERWRLAWAEAAGERQLAHQRLAQRAAEQNRPITFAESNDLDRECASQLPRPAIAALLDHIEHLMAVAGANRVGLGSDFDGICSLPAGIDSAADLPLIAAELERRGHSEQHIRGIMGENLLALMRRVEAAAAALQR